MAQPARPVVITPTFSETEPGAQATGAESPKSRTDVGITSGPFSKITDGEASIKQLQKLASLFPNEMSMVKWVRSVFALQGESLPRSNDLTDGKLRFRDVLRFAQVWDELGASTPAEFVLGLACETKGCQSYQAVGNSLAQLGVLAW